MIFFSEKSLDKPAERDYFYSSFLGFFADGENRFSHVSCGAHGEMEENKKKTQPAKAKERI